MPDVHPTSWIHPNGFTLSDDAGRLDLDAVHAYLSRSYWSPGIPLDLVRRAAVNSLAVGLYTADGAQIGYARAVTDRATFAYLCDVYVLEPYQRRGLGTWMTERFLEHPDLAGLRRWMLTTQDAHAVYERAGFDHTTFPERIMTIDRPDAYR